MPYTIIDIYGFEPSEGKDYYSSITKQLRRKILPAYWHNHIHCDNPNEALNQANDLGNFEGTRLLIEYSPLDNDSSRLRVTGYQPIAYMHKERASVKPCKFVKLESEQVVTVSGILPSQLKNINNTEVKNLFSRIAALEDHGTSLCDSGEKEKGIEAITIAEGMRQTASNYFLAIYKNDQGGIDHAKTEFRNQVRLAESSNLNNHCKKWKCILANILISATIVGLAFVIGKLILTHSALFDKTDRQIKFNKIVTSFNNVIDTENSKLVPVRRKDTDPDDAHTADLLADEPERLSPAKSLLTPSLTPAYSGT